MRFQLWYIWTTLVEYKQSIVNRIKTTTILSRPYIKGVVYLLCLILGLTYTVSMVETIYDAIHTCNHSEINHLYVPEDQEVEIPWDMIRVKGDEVIDNSETNRDISINTYVELIELTDEAIVKLLEQQEKENFKYIRLGITGGGCAGFLSISLIVLTVSVMMISLSTLVSYNLS